MIERLALHSPNLEAWKVLGMTARTSGVPCLTSLLFLSSRSWGLFIWS